MILGEVVGRIWADRQVSGLDGRRLVVVRRLPGDDLFVAVDLIDVRTGNTVLVSTDEAVQVELGAAPVDAAVVARVAGMDPLPDPVPVRVAMADDR